MSGVPNASRQVSQTEPSDGGKAGSIPMLRKVEGIKEIPDPEFEALMEVLKTLDASNGKCRVRECDPRAFR